MNTSIKGNKPLRIFSAAMLVILLVAHVLKQVDLTQVSVLWLMIAMSINAFQATLTGFCPMFKNAKGECVACGVACDQTNEQANKLASDITKHKEDKSIS